MLRFWYKGLCGSRYGAMGPAATGADTAGLLGEAGATGAGEVAEATGATGVLLQAPSRTMANRAVVAASRLESFIVFLRRFEKCVYGSPATAMSGWIVPVQT